jgi:hypothetical protein
MPRARIALELYFGGSGLLHERLRRKSVSLRAPDDGSITLAAETLKAERIVFGGTGRLGWFLQEPSQLVSS